MTSLHFIFSHCLSDSWRKENFSQACQVYYAGLGVANYSRQVYYCTFYAAIPPPCSRHTSTVLLIQISVGCCNYFTYLPLSISAWLSVNFNTYFIGTILTYPYYFYEYYNRQIMISKPVYKLKTQSKKNTDNSHPHRYSTQYNSTQKSIFSKNKLTKGCQKYDQLKEAYSKQGENQLKTDYNEYTFEPKIFSKGKESRSFKKFIQDQENYQHNKNNKIKEFRTEMTKAEITECSSRPSIDKVSKRICTLMNYDKEEVVDRLYKKKAIEQYADDEQLFSPKILERSKTLKRNQNISDLLHSDALRRKEKREVQQLENQIQLPASPHILGNTYQLVCNKLYSQFCELAPEEEKIIPLVMAWTIISQMFGIQLNPNKPGRQGKICEGMTKYLCAEGEETVSRDKLWDFIQIIIKKNDTKSKNFADEIHEIIEQFGSLYTCRIAKPKIPAEPEQYSFFPQTLRSSDSKAQRHRQKILQSAKQFIQNENSKIKLKEQVTIQDIFSIDYMMRKASQEKKKMSQEKELMKQCTFKPKLSETYKRPSYMPPRAYQRKVASSQKTLLKSVSSQSLSMSQTFMSSTLRPIELKSNIKTTIRKQDQKEGNNISCGEIKNVEKSILRMAIARKDRELSNEIKNRGYPKNVQNWTTYAHQQKIQINKQHSKLKGFAYKKVSLR